MDLTLTSGSDSGLEDYAMPVQPANQQQVGRDRRAESGLIGTQVSKWFQQTEGAPPVLHHGSVESFNKAAARQYKVLFEDGDEEHWDRCEVVQRLRQPKPSTATAVTSRLFDNEQEAGENCSDAVEQEEVEQERSSQTKNENGTTDMSVWRNRLLHCQLLFSDCTLICGSALVGVFSGLS